MVIEIVLIFPIMLLILILITLWVLMSLETIWIHTKFKPFKKLMHDKLGYHIPDTDHGLSFDKDGKRQLPSQMYEWEYYNIPVYSKCKYCKNTIIRKEDFGLYGYWEIVE